MSRVGIGLSRLRRGKTRSRRRKSTLDKRGVTRGRKGEQGSGSRRGRGEASRRLCKLDYVINQTLNHVRQVAGHVILLVIKSSIHNSGLGSPFLADRAELIYIRINLSSNLAKRPASYGKRGHRERPDDDNIYIPTY